MCSDGGRMQVEHFFYLSRGITEQETPGYLDLPVRKLFKWVIRFS